MKLMKYAILIGLPLIIVVILALNSDKFAVGWYLSSDDLTEAVKDNVYSYKNGSQEEKDYLVYFYDRDKCDKCEEYVSDLKKYESIKGSFPVYKVDLSQLESEVITDKLFIDATQPYVFHIKDGDDYYSYVGGFPAEELPTESKQADPLQ